MEAMIVSVSESAGVWHSSKSLFVKLSNSYITSLESWNINSNKQKPTLSQNWNRNEQVTTISFPVHNLYGEYVNLSASLTYIINVCTAALWFQALKKELHQILSLRNGGNRWKLVFHPTARRWRILKYLKTNSLKNVVKAATVSENVQGMWVNNRKEIIIRCIHVRGHW